MKALLTLLALLFITLAGCLPKTTQPSSPTNHDYIGPYTVVLMTAMELEPDAPEISHFEWQLTTNGVVMTYRVRPGEVIYITALEDDFIDVRPVYPDGNDYGNDCRCGAGAQVGALHHFKPAGSGVVYAILEYEWSHSAPIYGIKPWQPWHRDVQNHGQWMIENRPRLPDEVQER